MISADIQKRTLFLTTPIRCIKTLDNAHEREIYRYVQGFWLPCATTQRHTETDIAVAITWSRLALEGWGTIYIYI